MGVTYGRYHFPRGLPPQVADVEMVDGQYGTHVVSTNPKRRRLQERGIISKPLLEHWAADVASRYPDWVEVLPLLPMTREKAIEAIHDSWGSVEAEFISTDKESAEHWEEFERVCRALGITDAELEKWTT